MELKTLITFLRTELLASNYPIIEEISTYAGFSGMSIKEAKAYFYGFMGLTMYDVIVTKIERDDQDFYKNLGGE